MSIDTLKQELAGLDEVRRIEMVAYLLSLNDQQHPEIRSRMARLIDDQNPANWLTIEEVDRRLGITDDERKG